MAAPGQSLCDRILNRFRFRKAVLEVLEWWITPEGEFSQEFLDMLCAIDCEGLTSTTTAETTTTTTEATTTTSTTTEA